MAVIHAMIGNAAIAAVLALIAIAIGFACRSPAIRHAAWVIVLLKFVTPPLWTMPLPVLPAGWNNPPEPFTGALVIADPTANATLAAAETGSSGTAPSQSYGPRGWLDWLLIIWAAGSVGWFVWQGRRVLRFRRRVANAGAAPPEVAAAVARLAEQLGIRCAPEVKTASGIGSPMLWGWGRGAVILFPRDLLARLSPDARDTLLAHELAHFLRRDHWVRVLEYVATGLYWWHPAVWLARAGIEAAEEECCDAWVVAGLSASPRRYAEALLATVDFEAEMRRPCLPPGACAANRSARILRRRLESIIDARAPRRIRGAAAVRVVVLAALVIQPELCSATADDSGDPVATRAASELRHDNPPTRSPRIRPREPRAWATAENPQTGTVVAALDRQVVLRHADGTTAPLGPGRPIALSFAPDSQQVATAGPGSLVRTWDLRGTLLAETHLPAAARAIAYSPDAESLLVLDATGRITVHDPESLETVASWYVEGAANSLSIAPDGRSVAVSFGSWLGGTGWVELWSIDGRQKKATYWASGPVGATRFSPDGSTLVIGCWSGQVVWQSLATGQVLAERQLSKDLVASTAFCPEAGLLPLVPPPEPAPPPRSLYDFTDGIGFVPIPAP